MPKLRTEQWMRVAVLAAAIVGAGGAVAAGEVVRAGSDALNVVVGPGSRIDFSAEPLPAGLFGPFSKAFTGVVPLEARRLSMLTPDASFQRPGDVAVGAGGEAVIASELTTLELVSVAPITIDMGFYPAFFDVIIRIPLDQPALGQWAVRENAGGGGGTILRDLPGSDAAADSFLDLTYELEFAETCACSWTQAPDRSDRLNLAADVPYSAAPPSEVMTFPSSSNFFPGGLPGAPDEPPLPLQLDGAVLHLTLELMPDLHLPSNVMGDADYDLDVDLDDFIILKTHFGTQTGATWDMGDFNLSGSVDLDDFILLKTHFGTGVAH